MERKKMGCKFKECKERTENREKWKRKGGSVQIEKGKGRGRERKERREGSMKEKNRK